MRRLRVWRREEKTTPFSQRWRGGPLRRGWFVARPTEGPGGLGRERSFIDNQERGRRLGQRPGPWNPRHRVSPLILSRTSSLCPSLPRSLTEGTEHCLCLTSCTSTVLLFFFNAFTVLIESLLLTFATYVSISIECVRLYCFN